MQPKSCKIRESHAPCPFRRLWWLQ